MPNDETVTRLERENAELKLRVRCLELYIELINAPINSTTTHSVHGKIRMLEMSQEWRAIQPEKIL